MSYGQHIDNSSARDYDSNSNALPAIKLELRCPYYKDLQCYPYTCEGKCEGKSVGDHIPVIIVDITYICPQLLVLGVQNFSIISLNVRIRL